MHTDQLSAELELLEQALDLETTQRRGFLDRHIGDPGLDRCLRTTTTHNPQGSGSLDGDVQRDLQAPAAQPSSWVGRRIGAYQITGLIAEGGMGSVFRARRADCEFTRDVAIKVTKRVLTPQASARFRVERQLLARLEHPSIARLYDGGTTEEGTPYLIMELIDGDPIDHYCDRLRLPIEARLRLLCDVLAAVQHAHRHSIVHRDLKPQNILVTGDGRVKLLDFGIATMVKQSRDEPSWCQPMTPAFASPEQLLGNPTTTSSDLYSFGVVAHQLLAGVTPYAVTPDSPRKLRLTVLEDDPPGPSLRLARLDPPTLVRLAQLRSCSTRTMVRRMRGDLDAIVLTALAKRPEDRYPSAASIAADIGHHLNQRPIEIRGPSRAYRIRKLLQRHAIEATIMGLACISILGFAGALAISTARTSHQRELAQHQRLQAGQDGDVLVELIRSTRVDSADIEQLAHRLLISNAHPPTSSSPSLSLHAARLHALADLLLDLGRFERAAEVGRQAVALRQRIFGAVSLEAAESENLLATIDQQRGHYNPSERGFRQVLSSRERLLGSKHPDTAMARNNLGLLLWRRGEIVEAQTHLQRALEDSRDALGEQHPGVLASLSNLALVQQQRGELEVAEILHRRALQLARQLFGKAHLRAAVASNNLAMVLLLRDRLEEAEGLARDSLSIRRDRLGEQHPSSARAMHNLGLVLLERGELEEAAELLSAGLEIRLHTLAADHPDIRRSKTQLKRVRRLDSLMSSREPLSEDRGSQVARFTRS